jgi:hypothetical protein
MGCGISRPKMGFDIQPAQLVASHYIDYAILARRLHIYSISCCVVFLLVLRKYFASRFSLSGVRLFF